VCDNIINNNTFILIFPEISGKFKTFPTRTLESTGGVPVALNASTLTSLFLRVAVYKAKYNNM